MNFRHIAGLFFIALALYTLPAAALPDLGALPHIPSVRTGTVWVTMTDINGTGNPENVAFAYGVGDVSEISGSAVYTDEKTGIVTVTMDDGTPVGRSFSLSDNNNGNGVYLVQSITVATESEPLLQNDLSFAVVPPTANYYMDTVPAGKQHEWIDLDWKNPSKDLNLTVYAPDETFGPYNDMADGKKDGRIFLDISSLLNVTPGTWFFKVQNNQQGYLPYILNTYSA
ncbi:MAG: hypothetical protein WC379_09070 [Methanoregula sp.]|jgi:hypothetical protein